MTYVTPKPGRADQGTPAVGGIDLTIRQGEVFALLGPNGAGKTTTVEILEGYRTRDSGEVSVLGVDPGRQRARLKSRTRIVLQSTGIDRYLTVHKTIAMYATFYPHPRPADEVIGLVGLEEKQGTRVGRLSGGQQRRLDVAIALVGNPELLFLDEPTTGFDPSARREAWDAHPPPAAGRRATVQGPVLPASNASMFLSGFGVYGALLLLPLYYQQIRGQSAPYAGLLLAPQALLPHAGPDPRRLERRPRGSRDVLADELRPHPGFPTDQRPGHGPFPQVVAGVGFEPT